MKTKFKLPKWAEEHFSKWLDYQYGGEAHTQRTIRSKIHELLAEYPDFLETKSWREMLDLTDYKDF